MSNASANAIRISPGSSPRKESAGWRFFFGVSSGSVSWTRR